MTTVFTRALRAALVPLLAFAALMVGASAANAAACLSGTADGDYCYTDNGTNATIVDYTGTADAITIPGTLGGYPVASIGVHSFYSKGLTSVTLPDSVTSIGYRAFGSNNLATVNLDENLRSIGSAAFDTNSLTSVTIPASVTSVGAISFNNNGLASVKFEGNEPTMGASAPFGLVGAGNDPLVSYYARNTGFASPTWTVDSETYRSQALATVTYDANGHGTAPSSADVVVGASTSEPTAPSQPGYTFAGWFNAATGGSAFNFAAPITADTTVYAHWGVLASTGTNPLPGGLVALALLGIGVTLVARRRRS